VAGGHLLDLSLSKAHDARKPGGFAAPVSGSRGAFVRHRRQLEADAGSDSSIIRNGPRQVPRQCLSRWETGSGKEIVAYDSQLSPRARRAVCGQSTVSAIPETRGKARFSGSERGRRSRAPATAASACFAGRLGSCLRAKNWRNARVRRMRSCCACWEDRKVRRLVRKLETPVDVSRSRCDHISGSVRGQRRFCARTSISSELFSHPPAAASAIIRTHPVAIRAHLARYPTQKTRQKLVAASAPSAGIFMSPPGPEISANCAICWNAPRSCPKRPYFREVPSPGECRQGLLRLDPDYLPSNSPWARRLDAITRN